MRFGNDYTGIWEHNNNRNWTCPCW